MTIYGNLIRKLKEERLDSYGHGYDETGHDVTDHIKSPYDQSRQLLDEVAKIWNKALERGGNDIRGIF